MGIKSLICAPAVADALTAAAALIKAGRFVVTAVLLKGGRVMVPAADLGRRFVVVRPVANSGVNRLEEVRVTVEGI